MRQSTATLLLSALAIISSVAAQAVPDGLIVPFTSKLPACASNCGPLFDVQGKCSPPNIAAIDSNCFCTDARLTPFDNAGTAGVTLVCGAQSCTAAADLQTIKSWYDGFCKQKKSSTTTASNGAATTQTGASSPNTGTTSGSGSSSSNNTNGSWMSTHYKWVIMIVVIFVVIVAGWIAACLFRRRYLRRKEREIEMKPPVAWGPHQMQGATGGYNYGDGIVDSNRGTPNSAGGHAKEYAGAAAMAAEGKKSKRESKGLQKKTRT